MKNIIWILECILLGCSLLLIQSCKDKDESTVPVLSSSVVGPVTDTTAFCGGEILSDGGAAVISRGVCWSTSSFPEVTDNKTVDSNVVRSDFNHKITGLTPYTRYYARIYATNVVGTGYGEEIQFTTQGGTVTDIDGNVYQTISIGSQVWMAENLKCVRYNNGDSIPYIGDYVTWINLRTGAYCNYNNDILKGEFYGRLYNFYALADNRGLAPAGWHLPDADEWMTLFDYLGGYYIAGGKLKESGTAHWLAPNAGATNETGFTALPGGYFGNDSFLNMNRSGLWWMYSLYNTTNAWFMSLSYQDNQVNINYWPFYSGLSVRCIRDYAD